MYSYTHLDLNLEFPPSVIPLHNTGQRKNVHTLIEANIVITAQLPAIINSELFSALLIFPPNELAICERAMY